MVAFMFIMISCSAAIPGELFSVPTKQTKRLTVRPQEKEEVEEVEERRELDVISHHERKRISVTEPIHIKWRHRYFAWCYRQLADR